jgi:hypothetical protein
MLPWVDVASWWLLSEQNPSEQNMTVGIAIGYKKLYCTTVLHHTQ